MRAAKVIVCMFRASNFKPVILCSLVLSKKGLTVGYRVYFFAVVLISLVSLFICGPAFAVNKRKFSLSEFAIRKKKQRFTPP